jgi:hypothetical protein
MKQCIIMLKHEVMAADEWRDNRAHEFVYMVSLWFQIDINKNPLCSIVLPHSLK